MILALNAGSTSLKFSLFDNRDDLPLRARGSIDHLGSSAIWHITGAAGHQIDGPCDHQRALELIRDWVQTQGKPDFCVHRFVHGGPDFRAPVRLDDGVLAALERLVPLAPLHQPHHLAAVRGLQAIWPDLPQIACFDTSFHADHTPIFYRMALPTNCQDDLLRRYGFHGLSYQWVRDVLRRDEPALAAGRVVICHLGGGSSLCALYNGISVDTSMGMTALDGVPMSTRCGAIDPGAILYLLREGGYSVDELEHLLYEQSGLTGLSGISGDMKTLLASPDPAALMAVQYYALRVAKMVASLAVSLGGIDGLVFTGGIGEHAEPVRQMILGQLTFLTIPRVLVIATDEERMMAIQARTVTGQVP